MAVRMKARKQTQVIIQRLDCEVLETDGIGELVTQNYSKVSILEEWEVDGAKRQVWVLSFIICSLADSRKIWGVYKCLE